MPRRELLSLTTRRILVLDGGISTSFSNFGKDRQPPPEMAVLKAFGEVVSMHERYARAGADILLTNTFGANRARLTSRGLVGQLEELNRRGVLAARRAANGRCLVAANMGPTGL